MPLLALRRFCKFSVLSIMSYFTIRSVNWHSFRGLYFLGQRYKYFTVAATLRTSKKLKNRSFPFSCGAGNQSCLRSQATISRGRMNSFCSDEATLSGGRINKYMKVFVSRKFSDLLFTSSLAVCQICFIIIVSVGWLSIP